LKNVKGLKWGHSHDNITQKVRQPFRIAGKDYKQDENRIVLLLHVSAWPCHLKYWHKFEGQPFCGLTGASTDYNRKVAIILKIY